MNDNARFEPLFVDGLHDLAPARAPDRLRTQVKSETSSVRPRPRWLALIKEPPMRTNSRLAVGSPTARVAAIAAATLLLVSLVIGASFAGARIFGADGPIVVDQSGGGDYTTITEAVAAASDGDEIHVRPGTYVEAVIIEKDITLRGDGPIEDIVITAPEDGPTAPLQEGTISADPYALLVRGTDATISGLTFLGVRSEVILDGGSPTMRDSVFTDVGIAYDGRVGANVILVTNGATATVSGNQIRDSGQVSVMADADPTISGNTLAGGAHIYLDDPGTATVIEKNTIDGTLMWAIYLGDDGGAVTMRENVITNPGQNGIHINGGHADIVGNEIQGATSAGIVVGLGPASITGNTLWDNQVAISGASREGSIADNVVRGGGAGIVLLGDLDVSGNDVEGVAARGITVAAGGPVLRDNRSCGNGENLFVVERATPDIDDSNEICEDLPAE